MHVDKDGLLTHRQLDARIAFFSAALAIEMAVMAYAGLFSRSAPPAHQTNAKPPVASVKTLAV
jgi:hypothetical protein